MPRLGFAARQVFVHTQIGTNIKFKKDDISWVTQLTTDRLDIFSQVIVILAQNLVCIKCILHDSAY